MSWMSANRGFLDVFGHEFDVTFILNVLREVLDKYQVSFALFQEVLKILLRDDLCLHLRNSHLPLLNGCYHFFCLRNRLHFQNGRLHFCSRHQLGAHRCELCRCAPSLFLKPLQSLLGHIWWHVPHLNKSQIQLWLGRVALGAFFQMAKHGRPTLFASPDWLDFRTTICHTFLASIFLLPIRSISWRLASWRSCCRPSFSCPVSSVSSLISLRFFASSAIGSSLSLSTVVLCRVRI
mmetsp:Transcript_41822/g.90643  ORF Transcript_41822/g.90643 Transcript_41822/m.90643 type:complete len:236 (+) Transcript_41822:368-1075(+)